MVRIGSSVFAAVIAGGCLREPVRDIGDGGDGDGGVDVAGGLEVSGASGATITNGAFTMHFGGAWEMPDSLTFTAQPGVELLADRHPFDEDAIGMALYPTYVVNGLDPGANDAQAIRQVTGAGPAKVTVEVDWSGPAPCTGGPPTMNNRSTFSFFANGRIVRHDTLDIPFSCDITIGSTNSFRWSQLPTLYIDDAGAMLQYAHEESAEDYDQLDTSGWACIQGGTRAIGMTWRPPANPQDFESFEVGRFPPAADSVHFSYYFAENEIPSARGYTSQSAMFIKADGTQCADLGPRELAAFQVPPTLTNAVYRALDGVYVVAAPIAVTADNGMPPGLALELHAAGTTLRLSRQSSAPGRTSDLTAPADYLIQRDPADGALSAFTIVLSDALLPGESLLFTVAD